MIFFSFFAKVTGSVTSSTICLGDVDNDGEFELCIGSPTGQLSIFKGGLEPNMTKREVRTHPKILLITNIFRGLLKAIHKRCHN